MVCSGHSGVVIQIPISSLQNRRNPTGKKSRHLHFIAYEIPKFIIFCQIRLLSLLLPAGIHLGRIFSKAKYRQAPAVAHVDVPNLFLGPRNSKRSECVGPRKRSCVALFGHWDMCSMGQDPKMELLYYIRAYLLGIFSDIGLKNRP